MKIRLVLALLCSLSLNAFAAGGGAGKPSSAGTTPAAAPAPSAPAAAPGGTAREGALKQIETFTRSVLPTIIATEHGDDSSLAYLKDKVTYFDTLQKQCLAAKGSGDAVAIIKKLDPSDITIDTVKNEARVNVMGNLVFGGATTPTLWVVSIKIAPANSVQPYAVSQILAAKMPVS
jgi:hypothetical protein